MQTLLNVRREFTDSRTRAISLIAGRPPRSRPPYSQWEHRELLARVAALDLPSSLAETLAPLQRLIAVLTEELATADERLRASRPKTPSWPG